MIEKETQFGTKREHFGELSALLDSLHKSFPLRIGRPTLTGSPTLQDNVGPLTHHSGFYLGWYTPGWNRIDINYQLNTAETAKDTLMHEYAHAMCHNFPIWALIIIQGPWILLTYLPKWTYKFWGPLHVMFNHGPYFKWNMWRLKKQGFGS